MKSAIDVHQVLLARGTAHEVVRLSSPANHADDLPRLLDVPRRSCVAVRCYRVEDARTPDGAAVHLAAVLVRAGDTPDEDAVRRALSARTVRPATPDEVSHHTDFAAGLVSPIGLPEDVVLLADTALADPTADPLDAFYCATGESGTALAVRLRDLLVESGARVAALTPRRAEHRPDWRTGGVAGSGQVISIEAKLSDRVARANRSAG